MLREIQGPSYKRVTKGLGTPGFLSTYLHVWGLRVLRWLPHSGYHIHIPGRKKRGEVEYIFLEIYAS
jgi:hypothetical protein